MRDIGGYMELIIYALLVFRESAAALDCNRNGIKFFIRVRGIKKIVPPISLFDSSSRVRGRNRAEVKFDLLDMGFMPDDVAEDCCKFLERIHYGNIAVSRDRKNDFSCPLRRKGAA